MKKTISFVMCLMVLSTISYGQSAYFYKTTKSLELEKWDAKESANTAAVSEIAKELESRAKKEAQISELEAELAIKLKNEAYFEADNIKNKLEKLKADKAKSDELRQHIETALATEDYEKAARYKQNLLHLSDPSASASDGPKSAPAATGSSTLVKAKTTTGQLVANPSSSSSMRGAFVTSSSNQGVAKAGSSHTGNTDSYGRTLEENRRIATKRRRTGTILMSVGGALLIPGAVLIGIGASTFTDGFAQAGAITGVAGLGLLIPGAAIFGSSKKYNKRADLLSIGSASLSPSLIHTHSFNGSMVKGQMSGGMTLSYTF